MIREPHFPFSKGKKKKILLGIELFTELTEREPLCAPVFVCSCVHTQV